jgi:hypothetical protein
MHPFNLLWVVASSPEKRPIRAIPSWSWGSADGRIAYRLQVPDLTKGADDDITRQHRFESPRKEITPLISHENIHAIEEINGLVLDGTLSLRGCVHSVASHQVNINYDTGPIPSSTKLFYLPILAFENAELHPAGSKIQLHGLVVQKSHVGTMYMRVGYFWFADSSIVEQFLKDQNRASMIDIL